MAARRKQQRPEKLRVSATVVLDAAALERARAKAGEHDMAFSDYLEKAVKLYGKYLDKKVSVISRPV